MTDEHLIQQLLINIGIIFDSSNILSLLHKIAMNAIAQPYKNDKWVNTTNWPPELLIYITNY